MGGKWSSFRHMGEETVDKISEAYGIKALKSQSEAFRLLGAYSIRELLGHETIEAGFWTCEYSDRLVRDHGVSHEVAEHLVLYYGTRALKVVQDMSPSDLEPIVKGLPYT